MLELSDCGDSTVLADRLLDVLGEAALARAFERAKRRGMTVVAVTQRPSLLRSVDKIMMIKDGAVQAIGTGAARHFAGFVFSRQTKLEQLRRALSALVIVQGQRRDR